MATRAIIQSAVTFLRSSAPAGDASGPLTVSREGGIVRLLTAVGVEVAMMSERTFDRLSTPIVPYVFKQT